MGVARKADVGPTGLSTQKKWKLREPVAKTIVNYNP
jgi:hypothetical protein